MPDKDYITVSQLNYYINNIFLSEELLHNVPVMGEVSGCKTVNGNCYFTLKDENAQIRVIYFRYDKNSIPSDGEKVLIRGAVDYYQATGQISVKAYEINRFGIGEMHTKLQILKEKLTEEGLFRDEYKKTIPSLPKNIAIITSVKGAALQDILYTFGRRNSNQNITVVDVRVQGDNCVSDVVTALTNTDSYGFDVIVLARGGGSFEDLFPFNDEKIVRTIFGMSTPIITAIGHETDYTLCDFVSDYRAITPTAAAEKIAVDVKDEKKEIINLLNKIKEIIENKFNHEKYVIKKNVQTIALSANSTIQNQYDKVINQLNFAKIYVENNYRTKNNIYSELLSKIDILSPVKLLNKGYFRILYNEQPINNFSKIKLNEEISIIGSKDKVKAIVVKKEKL